MELEKAIKNRRSIRKYNSTKVEKEIINKIIEAGIWAPSACNIQGWKFIIIDDKDILSQIVKAGAASFLSSANQAILVLYDNQTDNIEYSDYIQSASACVQNMLLRAYSLDVGTCWVNNLPNKSRLRKMLNIPDFYSPIALVTLGYYDQTINARPRKYEINDVISYNSFLWDDSNTRRKNRFLLFLKRTARKVYKILPFKKQLLKIVGRMEKKFDN